MRDNSCIAFTPRNVTSCIPFFLNAKDELDDNRTAAARRRARVPDAVRLLYVQIADCGVQAQVRLLHAQVQFCFRQHRARFDAERAHYILRSGRG